MVTTCAHATAPTHNAATCPVCPRLQVEAKIVTMTVDALLAAGYRLQVDNGGGPEPRTPAGPIKYPLTSV